MSTKPPSKRPIVDQASELRTLAATSRTHTSVQAFTKLTHVRRRPRRIVERPPLIVRFDEDSAFEAQMIEFYGQYRASLPDDRRQLVDQYRFRDVAQKVVGVGSVGTRCAVILFEGRGALDPLFLQMKEAGASVLEPHVGCSEYAHSGQRVVVGSAHDAGDDRHLPRLVALRPLPTTTCGNCET